MPPQDRLRLRRNPPNVSVPQGTDDLYFDTSGNLIHESPGGVKETVLSNPDSFATADQGVLAENALPGTLSDPTIEVEVSTEETAFGMTFRKGPYNTGRIEFNDGEPDAVIQVSGVSSISGDNTGDNAPNTNANAYADSLVVGLLDDRGNYNASGNTFPASGGSGSAGAILKGDLWMISVAGTLGGSAVTAGDVVRALTNTPGQTAGNWVITENNIGYVPVNATQLSTTGGANKVTQLDSVGNLNIGPKTVTGSYFDGDVQVTHPSTSEQTYLIHEKFLGIGLNDPITTAAAGIISGAKDRICNPGPGLVTFTFSSFSGTRVLDGLQYVVNTEASKGQIVHSKAKITVIAGLALITKFTATSYCRDNITIGWGNSETSCDSTALSISQAAIDGTQNQLTATLLYAAGSGLYDTTQVLSKYGLEDGETYRVAVEWKTATQIRIWIQGGTWAKLYDAQLDSDRWFPLIDHKVQTTNASLYAIVQNFSTYGNSTLKMQEFSVVQNFSPSQDLRILAYNEVGISAHIPAILPLSDGTEIATWQKGTADASSDQSLWGAVKTATGWTAPQSLIPSLGDGSVLQNGSMALVNGQIWWVYMRSNSGVTAYPHYYRILTVASGVISMGAETAISNLDYGYLSYGPPIQTPTGRIIIPSETYDPAIHTFTAATSDICTSTAHGYQTGYCVRVSSTTTLPAGLLAGTDYYMIRLSANTFSLATTHANALTGTAVDITSTGTGTHTVSGGLVGNGLIRPALVYSDNNGSTWTTINYGSASMPGHSPEYSGYSAEMTIALEPSGTTLRAITRASVRGTGSNPANPSGMSLTATSTDNGSTWSTFEPYVIAQTIDGASGDAGQRVVARQMPDGRIIAFGSDDLFNRRRLTAWIIGNGGVVDDQMLFANTPERSGTGNQQYPDGFYKNGYLVSIWADKTYSAGAPNAKSAIVYVRQKWRSGRVRDTTAPVNVPYTQNFTRATIQRTVALVDAATITLNADEGNLFEVLMTSGVGATRVIGNPSNPVNGQEIIIRIRQASDTGLRAVTLGSAWRNTLTLTVSASANGVNYLTGVYDGKDGKWDAISFI